MSLRWKVAQVSFYFYFYLFFMRACVWFEMERGREFVGRVKKEVKGGGGGGVFIYVYIYRLIYTLPVLPCSECSSSS